MEYNNLPISHSNPLVTVQSNPSNLSLYYANLPDSQNPNSYQCYAQPAPSAASTVDNSAAIAYYTYAIQHGGFHESLGHYWDPVLQNWVATGTAGQVGSDPAALGAVSGIAVPPNGTKQSAAGILNSASWSNLTAQSHNIVNWKKLLKKTKIVQPAYCEICQLHCNSKDVLDTHRLGKKHKNNLDKLLGTSTPAPPVGSTGATIGPPENPHKKTITSNSKKKAAAVEDLESKRRKVVQGGAAMAAVRTCLICNVVCNSETVFRFHIAGQKHAAMVKKLQTQIGQGTGQ